MNEIAPEPTFPATNTSRFEIAAWLLAAAALFFVLHAHLLPALLAGLLVHELVGAVSHRRPLNRLHGSRAKLIVVALLATAIVSLLVLGVMSALSFFHSEEGSLSTLLTKLAEILDSSRAMLPLYIQNYIPENAETLRQDIVIWLREHAVELQRMGKQAGVMATHILIGLILGGLIALREVQMGTAMGPLSAALAERATRFAGSFRRVVFAQFRIALINAIFTGIYLGIALPILGIDLPLLKTLILLTFILGLIPVVGNLISNTIIVIVSLSVSLKVALISLAYLVIIHKLEYFLNARIVGTQIKARAWEILLAMLVMESAFGIAGVVAAPIYYAYLKNELSAKALI